MSEEELASLALISPAKTSQYSGSRVKALIQILQHQLDQQELVKEFMVSMCMCKTVLKRANIAVVHILMSRHTVIQLHYFKCLHYIILFISGPGASEAL